MRSALAMEALIVLATQNLLVVVATANWSFNKLLKLPEKTLVYPAHDYNGKKYSTIENEKNNNPRLKVSSKEQYAEIMNNLNLANPKMMDVAVPANVKGLTLDRL